MLTTDTPRVQPHDLEAEQAILGAILIDSTALARAQELLTAADFYDSRHQRIFAAMVHLGDRHEPIDLVTLGDRLESLGELASVGSRGSLADLLTVVASPVNVAHHAEIVLDHAKRRYLIRLAFEVSERAYGQGAVDQLVRYAEKELLQLSTGDRDGAWCSGAALSRETVDYVDTVYKRGASVIGIPTGFRTLDSMLGGWQRSNLVIIAARPSMGKTALALCCALAAAKTGHRVGIFSLEMSRREIGLRLHAIEGSIDVHALKTGQLSQDGWRRFASATQTLEALPLWVDPVPVQTADMLAAKARKLKATDGLDLLVVDYLQLLDDSDAETRQLAVAEFSRKLKLLAKELDVPILCLSQLSRETERRGDRRPMLCDLRDSGAIEQDADIVMFIYRHQVYVPDTEEKGVAEILVRKHRNGPIGDRHLKFVDRFARFEDLEP